MEEHSRKVEKELRDQICSLKTKLAENKKKVSDAILSMKRLEQEKEKQLEAIRKETAISKRYLEVNSLQVVMEKLLKLKFPKKHLSTHANELALLYNSTFLAGQFKIVMKKKVQSIIRENNPYQNARILVKTMDLNVPLVNP